MQFSADFAALHAHQADVRHAERELGLRRDAEAAGSDDAMASAEPARHHRHHRVHRAPRLALR